MCCNQLVVSFISYAVLLAASRESSEWEAKFYQIQSKYLLLLNELHSPRATQDDRSIVTRLLQDVVEAHGPPDLR